MSKPFFVKSCIEGIEYRGNFMVNDPVNLNNCKSISKSTINWYPDNVGKPTIVFFGCDCQWIYENEEQRDSDFNKISSNLWD